MEGGLEPRSRVRDQAVFHRVEVRAIDIRAQIAFAAVPAFPEATLQDAALPFCDPRA